MCGISIEEIMQTEPVLQSSQGAPTPLGGGLMNRLYRVDTANKAYCVKIFGSQAGNLTLDRKDEIEACEQAGVLGVSPAVAVSNREKGYYITDFFNGPPLDQFNVHHADKLVQIASLVKTIHQNMHVDREFGAFELIDRYTENISRLKAPVPDGYASILKKTEEIRKKRSMDKTYHHVFCHNDIWKNNLLHAGGKMVAIDWELCGYGDAYFDLARIGYLENTTFEEEKCLLFAYFGFFDMEMYQTLQDMKYVGMVAELTWALFYGASGDAVYSQNFNYGEFSNFVAGKLNAGENHL